MKKPNQVALPLVLFISGILLANNIFSQSLYGNSQTQIEMLGLDMLHAEGYTGEGVKIAVIDAGFRDYDQISSVQNADVVETYDFVSKEADVTDDHSHGLEVFSVLAGVDSTIFIGSAPGASFYLYRSENVNIETRAEEDLWSEAAEKALENGVDIILTSLNYNTFDDASTDYNPLTDLDGQTSTITKKAQELAEKGVLVVCSAGNYGNKSWKYVLPPADAPDVIAVGSVTTSETRASFSSVGPTTDGRVKPDVVALGDNVVFYSSNGSLKTGDGTSYSAPLAAGLMACLKQKYPNVSNADWVNYVRQSASISDQPNDDIGYGLITYGAIEKVVTGVSDALNREVKEVVFYNLFGAVVTPEYSGGMVIRKTIYDDYSIQIEKIIR